MSATDEPLWGETARAVRDRLQAARVAGLHRLCRADYTAAQRLRQAQDHRDDANLRAHTTT